jgi:hypothetical protein
MILILSSHHPISDDALVRRGIFPTHFFGQKNPCFFDHFQRRSENTKHTFGNNKVLTLEGGQFDKASYNQDWMFSHLSSHVLLRILIPYL